MTIYDVTVEWGLVVRFSYLKRFGRVLIVRTTLAALFHLALLSKGRFFDCVVYICFWLAVCAQSGNERLMDGLRGLSFMSFPLHGQVRCFSLKRKRFAGDSRMGNTQSACR